MKYYLYVSDRKVDMLFDQIPRRLRRRLAAEAKVDLKIVSVTLTSAHDDHTRYSKLALVQSYIERKLTVGTIDAPEAYFRGTLPMRWGVSEPHRMTYFGGTTERAVVGLCGSVEHLIGAQASSTPLPDATIPQFESVWATFSLSPSSGPVMLSALDQLATASKQDKPAFMALGAELRAVLATTTNMSGPPVNVEFLAKRVTSREVDTAALKPSAKTLLHQLVGQSDPDSKRVLAVLGTPLYVAQTD